VLAAFINSLILTGVALFLCYEGYERIVHPEPVQANVMMVVGAVALLINGGITLAVARGRRDLNLRAVFIHNLGDALSNIAIIGGGWLIRLTGQRFIDPLLAFLIGGMILWSTLGIVVESANILLEAAPKGMSLKNVANMMLAVPGVREVHDVHIWSLGSSSTALSCHVQILDMPTSESERIGQRIREVLADGETAILFDPDDPDAFRAAIARLCADAVLRRRLGDAARRAVQRMGLTWESNARRIIGLCETLVKARPAAIVPDAGASPSQSRDR